ncbi:hypothetical protein OROMI_008500 [Orobanche minor]
MCSGAATDSTLLQTMNPGIKCDCNGNSTCHITGLRVYDLDIIGAIPDELWNLTSIHELIYLRMNFFTGPISPAIGRLNRMMYLFTKLISLGLGLNNFSGPSSFGNLTQLTQIAIASDNALTGRIPEFIGNMKLRVLRLQGNAFEGPIPASFSNLTTIEELMVSDLSRESSSLEFIINLKSLIRLVLRNNNISGSVPSNIGEYRNLTQLDLSFNNLTGSIPEFLGNNKLSDLSYNELSGDFPSWVSQNNLNLNLPLAVVHKLNLPIRFFTKPTMRLLGQQRWAVSNVALPTDATNPLMYKTFAVGKYGNTNDSELLQSSRVSAASLRYYGLGLENGNYALNLQFAEGLTQDPPSYEST